MQLTNDQMPEFCIVTVTDRSVHCQLQHKQAFTRFDKSFTALSIGPCGNRQVAPDNLRHFLEFSNCFWLCFMLLLSLQHRTPHVIVHWV